MDAKPHYFRIGMFVLLAVVLITMAVVIFGAGLLTQDQLLFESYFAESITGLSVGSPLEFRGVRIGQVAHIGFVGNIDAVSDDEGVVSRYAPYVRVVTAVPQSKLPDFATDKVEEVLQELTERGLRVRVMSNILTGQAYLEMNYFDPNRFPVEEVPWQPRHTRIPSAPGELTTLKDSIDSILTQLQTINVAGLAISLDKVLTSLDGAISDASLAELSLEVRALLEETRQKLADLETDRINRDVRELLASLNGTVNDANIPQLAQQTRETLKETQAKLAALDTEGINENVQTLMASLDGAVADANIGGLSGEAQALMSELRTTNKYLRSLLAPPEGFAGQSNLPVVIGRLSETVSNLNKVIATERPELETILADVRQILDSMQDLISTLKERPSELLFSRPPRRSEVFE